ncbi:hypothetical protein V5799_018190, partial [Amblyomma americanum]
MAATQISCRGYDPENMHWTTVNPAETEGPVSATVTPAAPGGPDSARFRSAALNAAVLRRAQDQALKSASVDAAGVHAGNQQSPAPRAAGRIRRLLTKWKPPVIPKPAPDDYVVVIKPRTRVSLYETFQETGYGRAFTALLGAQPATDLTIIPHHRTCGAHFNACGRRGYMDRLPTIFPHKVINQLSPSYNTVAKRKKTSSITASASPVLLLNELEIGCVVDVPQCDH